jgi:hypothetical protein
MKGSAEVFSYVLIVIIAISLTFTTYNWGSSYISKMNERAEFEEMISLMENLDNRIRLVSYSGNQSSDEIRFHLKKGSIVINSTDEKIEYNLLSIACHQYLNDTYLQTSFQETGGKCMNIISIQYDTIDIYSPQKVHSGTFTLTLENIGAQEAKPTIRIY